MEEQDCPQSQRGRPPVQENPNGFSTNTSGNEKLEKEKEVIDDLEVDLVAFPEHKVNCRHKHNRN